jgi:hypothetical protein
MQPAALRAAADPLGGSRSGLRSFSRAGVAALASTARRAQHPWRYGVSTVRGTLRGMSTHPDAVSTLERAAFEAWRAEKVVALGPWWLRFMHGVTNRAN